MQLFTVLSILFFFGQIGNIFSENRLEKTGEDNSTTTTTIIDDETTNIFSVEDVTSTLSTNETETIAITTEPVTISMESTETNKKFTREDLISPVTVFPEISNESVTFSDVTNSQKVTEIIASTKTYISVNDTTEDVSPTPSTMHDEADKIINNISSTETSFSTQTSSTETTALDIDTQFTAGNLSVPTTVFPEINNESVTFSGVTNSQNVTEIIASTTETYISINDTTDDESPTPLTMHDEADKIINNISSTETSFFTQTSSKTTALDIDTQFMTGNLSVPTTVFPEISNESVTFSGVTNSQNVTEIIASTTETYISINDTTEDVSPTPFTMHNEADEIINNISSTETSFSNQTSSISSSTETTALDIDTQFTTNNLSVPTTVFPEISNENNTHNVIVIKNISEIITELPSTNPDSSTSFSIQPSLSTETQLYTTTTSDTDTKFTTKDLSTPTTVFPEIRNGNITSFSSQPSSSKTEFFTTRSDTNTKFTTKHSSKPKTPFSEIRNRNSTLNNTIHNRPEISTELPSTTETLISTNRKNADNVTISTTSSTIIDDKTNTHVNDISLTETLFSTQPSSSTDTILLTTNASDLEIKFATEELRTSTNVFNTVTNETKPQNVTHITTQLASLTTLEFDSTSTPSTTIQQNGTNSSTAANTTEQSTTEQPINRGILVTIHRTLFFSILIALIIL